MIYMEISHKIIFEIEKIEFVVCFFFLFLVPSLAEGFLFLRKKIEKRRQKNRKKKKRALLLIQIVSFQKSFSTFSHVESARKKKKHKTNKITKKKIFSTKSTQNLPFLFTPPFPCFSIFFSFLFSLFFTTILVVVEFVVQSLLLFLLHVGFSLLDEGDSLHGFDQRYFRFQFFLVVCLFLSLFLFLFLSLFP